MRLSPDRKRVTLFYEQPLPASVRVRVTVNGDNLLDDLNRKVDADGDSVAGGAGRIDFFTLSLSRITGTEVFGYVFDSYDKNPDGSDIPVVGATIRVDGFPEANAVTGEDGKCSMLVDENVVLQLCDRSSAMLKRDPETGNLIIEVEFGRVQVIAEPRVAAERIFVSRREGMIRFSPHLFNTVDEIDRVLEILETTRNSAAVSLDSTGFGLPVGDPVATPERTVGPEAPTLQGRWVTLRPVDPERDGDDLYQASHGSPEK